MALMCVPKIGCRWVLEQQNDSKVALRMVRNRVKNGDIDNMMYHSDERAHPNSIVESRHPQREA